MLTVENPFSAAPIGATFIITPVNQAAVTLSFAGPLPDDRYTLTVRDSIRDYAGNHSTARTTALSHRVMAYRAEALYRRSSTVDSAAELAIWSGGSVYIDTNGNFTFDPNNADPANRDIVQTLGFTTDLIFAGDFAAEPLAIIAEWLTTNWPHTAAWVPARPPRSAG